MNELKDLEKSFVDMEKALSGRNLTTIVKKAAGPLQSAIQSAAPRKSGTLVEGIILHKERSRGNGKTVYDVYMDPAKNAIFQKPIQHPVRSKSPYAYYPASKEYGFFSRRPGGGMIYTRADGTKAHMDKVPGKHFMRTGVEVQGEKAKNEILGNALSAVEKAFGG